MSLPTQMRDRWMWLALLPLVALLGFYWHTMPEEGNAPPPATGVAQSRSPVVQPQAAASSISSARVASAPAVRVGAAAPAHSPDEVQVCGRGWVRLPVKPDGAVDDEALAGALQLPDAERAILANLRGAADPLSRAAAIWLEMAKRQGEALAKAGDCETKECKEKLRPSRESLDALAQLALSTQNPKVYALAFHACAAQGQGQGVCQMLNAAQWARLAPGNAAPWSFMADAALTRKDKAGAQEALYQMAHAQRSDLGFFDVTGAILGQACGNDSLKLGASSLINLAVGQQAHWGLPSHSRLAAACSTAELRDTNRAQICAAVAELWAERSDTLLERGLGISLGQRIGWPAERMDRMRGEAAAFTEAMVPREPEQRGLSCAELDRDLKQFARFAAVGEVGGLREWVSRSGKTSEDFMRAERMARETARASPAANAASRP